MDQKQTEGVLEEKLRPVIEAEGVELVEVEVTRGGRRGFVRLFVDRPEGISIGDCTKLSRRIAPLIDALELFEDRYVLEVSSPGVTRSLKREQDFVRFAGRLARIYLAEAVEDRVDWIGELRGMEGSEVLLRPLERRDPVRIPWTTVRRARLEYESPQDREARQRKLESGA